MMNQPSLLHQPRMAPICHHGFTAVIVRARLSSLGPESHRQASRLTIASQESVEAATAEEVKGARRSSGVTLARWSHYLDYDRVSSLSTIHGPWACAENLVD
jgi:hypothetical protein